MGEEELIVDEANDQSQSQPQKEDEKKTGLVNVADPKPAKPETAAVEKPKEDTKKSVDAKKTKSDEDLAKKTKEDADKKKADELIAQQKAVADLAAKKAEDKRQDDLNKHLTQPLYLLTQAGVQMMKDGRMER